MKLTDFEYYFDEKIIECGKKLFEDGAVKPDFQYNTLHHFKVKGSQIYYVTFSLRKDMVISVERCTCPYADRHLCKHMVACFYYLRNELSIQPETMFSEFFKKNIGILTGVSDEIIVKKFMQSVLKKIKKSGFIEYNKMPDFEIALNEAIDFLMDDFKLTQDEKDLFNTCIYLINLIASLKGNCDDSDGGIVRCLYTVSEILQHFITTPNNELFEVMYKNLIKNQDRYEFEQDELIRIAYKLAANDIQKQKMKNYLNNLIETDDYNTHFIELKNDLF